VDPVLHGVEALAEPLAGSVVTLGAFDGVHRGHQALIRAARAAADRHGVPALGFTFHPHPARVLAPERAPDLLIAVEERARIMRGFGLDAVVVQPFDRALAQVSADDFVQDYLVARLRPRVIVVGFNFKYGRGRAGNLEHLRGIGARAGYEVQVVDAVHVDEAVCSSTRVRERLRAGDVRGVARLLGRDHVLTGTVVNGDARGRRLGFPTANVEPDGELLPKAGVYATRMQVVGEDTWRASVTNVGRRPTFDGGHVTVETHVLDFDGDLYGRRVRVALVSRLRDERRFDGLGALTAQLGQDVAQARAHLRADTSAGLI